MNPWVCPHAAIAIAPSTTVGWLNEQERTTAHDFTPRLQLPPTRWRLFGPYRDGSGALLTG